MELSSNEIQKIIPHRWPFMLVDRITSCVPGVEATGIKCISANEIQFLGHFPEQHIMPGVLILEAMSQVGAIALLMKEENKGKIAVFGGIKNARFKRPVVPGDVLEMHCTLTKLHGPIGFGEAVAKVDGKVAATAEISFAVQGGEKDA